MFSETLESQREDIIAHAGQGSQSVFCFHFLKSLFIFRETGREGRREEEKHWCVRETWISCLSQAPHQGPGLQPRHVPWLGINWRPLTLLNNTQFTEPHQPGLFSPPLVLMPWDSKTRRWSRSIFSVKCMNCWHKFFLKSWSSPVAHTVAGPWCTGNELPTSLSVPTPRAALAEGHIYLGRSGPQGLCTTEVFSDSSSLGPTLLITFCILSWFCQELDRESKSKRESLFANSVAHLNSCIHSHN